MVLKWEPLAQKRMKEIIEYYLEVAGLRTAKKFREQFIEAANRLLIFPNMGSIEYELEGITPYIYRSIVVGRNYKIIYRIENEVIFIFTIWDCRQDPTKMKDEH